MPLRTVVPVNGREVRPHWVTIAAGTMLVVLGSVLWVLVTWLLGIAPLGGYETRTACGYLHNPALLAAFTAGDAMYAVSYYWIPAILIFYAWGSVPMRALFWLFGAFIMACGTTHLMNLVTLARAAYWPAATIHLAGGVISITTGIVLTRVAAQAPAFAEEMQTLKDKIDHPPIHPSAMRPEVREHFADLKRTIDRLSAMGKTAADEGKG